MNLRGTACQLAAALRLEKEKVSALRHAGSSSCPIKQKRGGMLGRAAPTAAARPVVVWRRKKNGECWEHIHPPITLSTSTSLLHRAQPGACSIAECVSNRKDAYLLYLPLFVHQLVEILSRTFGKLIHSSRNI